MVIYFIIIFLIANYEQWKSKKDILNPFHISSLAVLYYGLGPLVMEITLNNHSFSNIILWKYFIALNIAAVGLYLPYRYKFRFIKIKKLKIDFQNHEKNYPYILLLLFLLIFFYKDYITYFMVSNGGYENANTNRLNLNNYSGLNQYLLLLSITIIQILAIKNIKNKFTGSIISIFLASFSMLAGSRVLMINTLFMIIYHLREYIQKLKLSIVIIILLVSISFFTFFNHTRGLNLSIDKKVELFSKIYKDSGILSFILSGEFTNPGYSVINVIKGIDEGKINFSYGYYYMAELSAFIPKFILPRLNTIIIDYHLTFYKQEYLEGKGQAFSPIAEAYWNFGYLGVLIEFIIISMVLKWLYYYFKETNNQTIRYCYFLTFFSLNFALFRGTFLLTIKDFLMYTIVFIIIEYRSKPNTPVNIL